MRGVKSSNLAFARQLQFKKQKRENNLRQILLVGILFFTLSFKSYAQGYSFFNPTPPEKLKSMTTERPSKTSSSFTIDAGHMQIESTFYSLTKNNDKGVKTSSSEFGSTMFRLGLTESSEFSLVTSALIFEKTQSAESQRNVKAHGDTLLRMRYNLFGNNPDSGSSFAMIPYVKIPTNDKKIGNDYYEGGLKSQYDSKLNDDYSISYLFEVMGIKKSDNSSYIPAFSNAFDFGKYLNSKAYLYVEIASFKSTEKHSSAKNNLDFGLIYQVTANFTLDVVTNFGISKAADDFNFITGGSYRF